MPSRAHVGLGRDVFWVVFIIARGGGGKAQDQGRAPALVGAVHKTWLEHFQAKWEPVRRPEMRQLKEIERFRDSTQTESALVIPGRAEGASPESRSELCACIWIPDSRFAASGMTEALEHDPEKWEPVFGKDHAQTKS